MKLRTRLGVAGGLVLAVLVAVGVLLPRTVRAAQVDEVDRRLRSAVPITLGLASGFTPLPQGDPGGNGEPDGERGEEGEGAVWSDLYVARVDLLGQRTVRAAPSSTSGREPELPEVAADPRDAEPVTVGSVDGSGSWRAMLLTLRDGTRAVVAVPLDAVDATTQRLTLAILVAAAAVLLAMGAAGWWLLRLGLRPIAEVTEVADAIARGDRSRRVSTSSAGRGDAGSGGRGGRGEGAGGRGAGGRGERGGGAGGRGEGGGEGAGGRGGRGEGAGGRGGRGGGGGRGEGAGGQGAGGGGRGEGGGRGRSRGGRGGGGGGGEGGGGSEGGGAGGGGGGGGGRLGRGRGSWGTEADHLARAFNVMLDEQAATEAQLRQFVADASHELRTPVAAIGGFADLWRQGALRPDQLDDVMRRIGQESARMRGLVEDLLLLARLDEGRALALATEPVDLAALAADAVLDASATHPSRQVRLHAPDPVVVEGDEARLRQVVANLVSNALVHTGAAATVEVRAERQGGVALLGVSDDGPGMAPDAAARAFDRFWRGDPSRPRGGAGLGLPIVRGIVAAHHGEVSLDTSPDAGTTVRVALAVATTSSAPAPGAAGSPEP